MQEDLISMFNATMGTFVETAEDYIYAVIKSKFRVIQAKFKTGNDSGGDNKLDAIKHIIALLEKTCRGKKIRAQTC